MKKRPLYRLALGISTVFLFLRYTVEYWWYNTECQRLKRREKYLQGEIDRLNRELFKQ